MFASLDEAIALGESGKRKQDGGVPVFELRATPKAGSTSEEVEYEDVVWVTIFNKGDPKNVIERPLREEDKKRWPEYWKAYLENAEPPIDGIPLEDFPKITPAERERCKQLHIRTVQDLCDIPEDQLKRLGGRGYALQKAAKDYIAKYNDVDVSALMDQIAELQKELKELKSGNSTTDNTECGSGDKSAKAERSNGRRSGPGRKSASDSEDGGEEAS